MAMSSLDDHWDIGSILSKRGVVFTHLLDKNGHESHDQVVVFCLGDAYYTIPCDMVKTIQRLEDYQPLPLTRASIVGVISALGRLLVVLDLRPHPRTAAHAHSPAGKPVIVAGPDGSEVGLVVDELVAAPGFAEECLRPTVTGCTGKEPSDV